MKTCKCGVILSNDNYRIHKESVCAACFAHHQYWAQQREDLESQHKVGTRDLKAIIVALIMAGGLFAIFFFGCRLNG